MTALGLVVGEGSMARRTVVLVGGALGAVLLPVLGQSAALAVLPPEIIRVSVTSDGQQPGSSISGRVSTSGDGRFTAFTSDPALSSKDTNGKWDVYVHDRTTHVTTLVSVGRDGKASDGTSLRAEISKDGRFVAFESSGTNLIANDTNRSSDIFVRDLVAGTTELVTRASDGTPLVDEVPSLGAISADGRFVSFTSSVDGVVPGDNNKKYDVFVRDRLQSTTERVSVSSTEQQADANSNGNSAMSADGRFVAFDSDASNLAPNDTNGTQDVFVRDRQLGTTTRVSVRSNGTQSPKPISAVSSINAD